MSIFSIREAFQSLTGEMARAKKVEVTAADESRIAELAGKLVAAGTDRPAFERVRAEIEASDALKAADVIEIARRYQGGGRKSSSRKAALESISRRFVEIVRNRNKIKVAEKARPW